MNPRPAVGDAAQGFTLPELVVVLLLIGILAAFAAPRLNVQRFERQIFADELINAIRYARRTALQSGCPIRLTAEASSDTVVAEYTGAGGDPCPASPLPHPSRPGSFVLTGDIDAGGTVVFDAFGRTADSAVFTLASGAQIRIEQGTGHVTR
jgi:MSHA pilin protein MshC